MEKAAMSEHTPEPVDVTQADRDAAADSSPHNGRWGSLVRAGHLDFDPLVQAFARHRIAHTHPTPAPADVAGLVELIAKALYFDHVDQHGYPNGLPTWDEMSDVGTVVATDREHWCSMARAVLPFITTLSAENARKDAAVPEIWRNGITNTTIVIDGVRKMFAENVHLTPTARDAFENFDAMLDHALQQWFDATRTAAPTTYEEAEQVFKDHTTRQALGGTHD